MLLPSGSPHLTTHDSGCAWNARLHLATSPRINAAGGVKTTHSSTHGLSKAGGASTHTMTHTTCARPACAVTVVQVMMTVRATDIIESLMGSYGAVTRACAVIQLIGPRDKALAPLCRSCLPEGGASALQTHNVIILKCLLMLTMEMGGSLGESWSTVLEVLQRLDSALSDRGLPPSSSKGGYDSTPRTPMATPQKISVPVAATGGTWTQARVELEMGQLRLVLDRLFEESYRLDDASVATLLQALCRVSVNAVMDSRPDIVDAAGAGSNASVRLFGVDKLLVVMMHNLHRLPRLLHVAIQQLSQVALHTRATVRQYGMTSITNLVVAALSRKASLCAKRDGHRCEGAEVQAGDLQPGEELESGTEGTGGAKTPHGFVRMDSDEDAFDLERRLLAVYEELYRCPYSDTKNYVLEGMYQVLQSHGEQVGPAWPIVLALLKGVAQDDEEAHVRQAFMCVQLVRNDLVSVLPVDCLQLLLTTIGAYGCQGSDLNISLTAITLLMNIADFFSRERAALLSAFSEEGFLAGRSVSDVSGGDGGAGAEAILNVDQLWLVLYHRLRLLAVDGRIEVRQSALRSLFTTLETHSLVLEPASWEQVMHDALVP